MPRHSAPQQPTWLRPRLVVAFVVAAAGLVTAVWLPTRNDSADAAERNRSDDSRRSRTLPAFADDFSGKRGSTVDPAKWSLRTDREGDGPRFSESTRNARLDGEGNLVIVLRGEENDGLTTARLFSTSKLRGESGHIEARIKAPAGEGLRPAFEIVDADQQGRLNVLDEPVTDGDFHTYAVDWQPGTAVISVDGREVKRENVDTRRSFRLALTLTVDDNRTAADLPARMVVDSVSFSGEDASAEPTKPPASPPVTSPPATSPPPTAPPSPTPSASEKPSAPAAPAWAPFTDYVAGELVTFKGTEYQVQETHTSLPGWEPTALPALFKKI